MAVAQIMYRQWNPAKWNQALKPAVPWLLNFDPYPYRDVPR